MGRKQHSEFSYLDGDGEKKTYKRKLAYLWKTQCQHGTKRNLF